LDILKSNFTTFIKYNHFFFLLINVAVVFNISLFHFLHCTNLSIWCLCYWLLLKYRNRHLHRPICDERNTKSESFVYLTRILRFWTCYDEYILWKILLIVWVVLLLVQGILCKSKEYRSHIVIHYWIIWTQYEYCCLFLRILTNFRIWR